MNEKSAVPGRFMDDADGSWKDEEISIVAHELWGKRGAPEGSPEEDWFEAKRRLEQRHDRQHSPST